MRESRGVEPQKIVVNTRPYPGSRKVYRTGPHGIRVPMREVRLQPTKTAEGRLEENPPILLYDTSGPYTDPEASIDLCRGLPELRRSLILARAEYD